VEGTNYNLLGMLNINLVKKGRLNKKMNCPREIRGFFFIPFELQISHGLSIP